jgi:hypothetical protein
VGGDHSAKELAIKILILSPHSLFSFPPSLETLHSMVLIYYTVYHSIGNIRFVKALRKYEKIKTFENTLFRRTGFLYVKYKKKIEKLFYNIFFENVSSLANVAILCFKFHEFARIQRGVFLSAL